MTNVKYKKSKRITKRCPKKLFLSILVLWVSFAALVIACWFLIIKPTQDYNRAVKLYNAGQYVDAIHMFESLNGYKDSEKQIENSYSKVLGQEKYQNIRQLQVGDVFALGTYEQDNDMANGKEDIEWVILEKSGMSFLVISKYALDYQPYHKYYTKTTWETCELRKWLNEDYLHAAFSEDEQKMILKTTVTADKNPYFDISPGNDTIDKVFCLSIKEVNEYFTSDESRQCALTDYAAARGRLVIRDDDSGAKYPSAWWLRSPGRSIVDAAIVRGNGTVYDSGLFVDSDEVSVRPVLWIKLG